jgi:hypothetical protein
MLGTEKTALTYAVKFIISLVPENLARVGTVPEHCQQTVGMIVQRDGTAYV